MTPETHEQAMACLTCGLAGTTPPEHFPQEPGLWNRPCPQCGTNTVWVTEPRPRSEGDVTIVAAVIPWTAEVDADAEGWRRARAAAEAALLDALRAEIERES